MFWIHLMQQFNIDELLVSTRLRGNKWLKLLVNWSTLVRLGFGGCRDSVAALVPRAEIDGDINIHTVGDSRRHTLVCKRGMMSQADANLELWSIRRRPFTFINQLREKVGVMFGNPEKSPGGRALKFYACPFRCSEHFKSRGLGTPKSIPTLVRKLKIILWRTR